MGFLADVGVKGNFIDSFNWSAIGGWATLIFLAVVVLIIAGIGAFWYYSRKLGKAQFRNLIPIFMNVNGKHSRIDSDNAKEVFVPDSNVSLFFLKRRKIYIARPTRSMGKNEYWYSISPNGEWVNFDLTIDPEKDTLAIANIDHRDTRYAYINLKEIIKRNYKDKAVKWWKEYSHLITFIIVSIIFVGSIWILLAKVGTLIGELGPFVDKMDIVAEKLSGAVERARNINSGIVGG